MTIWLQVQLAAGALAAMGVTAAGMIRLFAPAFRWLWRAFRSAPADADTVPFACDWYRDRQHAGLAALGAVAAEAAGHSGPADTAPLDAA